MKTFLKLLAAGVLSLTASESFAQTRDLGAERLILDDGAGGILTVSYDGPGNATFVIPPGGGTTVQTGTLAGQTLSWDGLVWSPRSNLLNDGTDVTLASGNLLVSTGTITGDGSGLTDLNATNLASGTVNDARLSSNVALLNANNTFTGTNAFGAVTTTSVTGDGSGLTNLGADDIATGTLDDARLSSNVALLNANNTFTGTNTFGDVIAGGVSSTSFSGDGSLLTNLDASNVALGSLDLARISTTGALMDQALMYDGASLVYDYPTAGSLTLPFSQSASDVGVLFTLTNTDATTGGAASFVINNAANSATALRASTNGTGSALRIDKTGTGDAGIFSINDAANGSNAIYSETNGTGSALRAVTMGTGDAGIFTVNNALNASNALYAETNGSGSAVRGSNIGTGVGVYGAAAMGPGVYGSSFSSYAGQFEISNPVSVSPAVYSVQQGLGYGGHFSINNVFSDGYAVYGTTDGTALGAGVAGNADNGAGVYGTSISGPGGRFSGTPGVQIDAGDLTVASSFAVDDATGNVTTNGSVDAGGSLTTAGDLEFTSGTARIYNSVFTGIDMDDDLTFVNGSDLLFENSTDIIANVGAAVTIQDDLNVTGSISNSGGNVSVGDNLDVTGATTLSNFLIMPPQQVTITADNQAIASLTSSHLELRSNSVVPADRTFTLPNGTVEGQMLFISCPAGGGTCQIDDGGNMLLDAVTYTISPGHGIILTWSGSDWVAVAAR